MPFLPSVPAEATHPQRPGRPTRHAVGRLTEAMAALCCALALAVMLGVVVLWWNGRAEVALPLLTGGIGAAATAAGWTLVRQRSVEEALRDAHLEASALADLFDDAWQWRTDEAHRLTLLRPPRRPLPGRGPAEGTADALLWDLFGADRATARQLRTAAEARGMFDRLRAFRTATDGSRLAFELQAAVRTDRLGRFAGYIGTARPCDEDDALREDRRLLETLLQTLPLPVFLLADPACRSADAASGEEGGAGPAVAHCNAAARRLLGIDATAVSASAGHAGLDRLPPTLREGVRQALDDAELAPAEAPLAEGWRILARRAAPAATIDAADASSRAGLVLLLLPQAGFADDRPPARAAASAAVLRDDEERESFGYTVSHDLRAPLRVVDGFARILKEDYGARLDRVGNDHLDRVLGAASRMNGMIDALLALSRLSSRPLARQPVDLSQLAGFIVDELRRESPEREVDMRIEPGLIAEGDPTLLRIALENLLGNAWKYSAKVDQARIAFERTEQRGRGVYTVSDNGAGFDMRFADRLFGIFQRLHSASDFQGTGIGLASVRRIVRRHGGDIWAESQVGVGSRFHFTLAESGSPAGTAAPHR